MKIKEKAQLMGIPVIFLLFFASFANALSVGVITGSREKTISVVEKAVFTLSFYNLGSTPAIVKLKVETPLKVEYPDGQELILEPTNLLTAPKEQGKFFHLEGNKYAKIKSLSFIVHAGNENGTYPIKTLVEIRPVNAKPTSKIYQSVAQEIEYNFKLNVKGGNELSKANEENEKEIVETNGTSELKIESPVSKILIQNKKSEKNVSNQQTNLPTGYFVVDAGSILIVIFTLLVLIIIKWSSRFS
jgi:hypothetical protein